MTFIDNLGGDWLERHTSLYRAAVFDLGCCRALRSGVSYKDCVLQYAEQCADVDWSDSVHYIKADVLSVLPVFWCAGQQLEPLLDRLGRHSKVGVTGYFVTAVKPAQPPQRPHPVQLLQPLQLGRADV